MKKKVANKVAKKVAAKKASIPPFKISDIPAALAAAQIHRVALYEELMRRIDKRTAEAYDRCSIVVDSCMNAIRTLIQEENRAMRESANVLYERDCRRRRLLASSYRKQANESAAILES